MVRMSRLRTLLLSGPAPPDAAAVWFGDLPMDAPIECCYGPPKGTSTASAWPLPATPGLGMVHAPA